jgi:hypothetical protein
MKGHPDSDDKSSNLPGVKTCRESFKPLIELLFQSMTYLIVFHAVKVIKFSSKEIVLIFLI